MSSNMPAKEFSVRDPNYVDRVRNAFARQGFLRYVDVRVEEVAPGWCVIAADFRSELAQQNGSFTAGSSAPSPTRPGPAPRPH